MNKPKINSNNGFTLIEIMVVIVIISVILGFVTLSVGDGNLAQKLNQESQRLAYLLKLASQEAVMQSKEIGIHFGRDNYRFCELQTEMSMCTKCKTISNGVFKPRILPTGIETKVYLDGEPTFLHKNCQNMPQLLILSDGEFIPFEIIFTAEKLIYKLTGNMVGEITILADEAL
ncbi:MAG: type II secretion system minor pseudopilin GspH [Proteobacteria bacterium]|nr:type II secretion system minor pseudopilin GspH [Pseudomonadota bacterium]